MVPDIGLQLQVVQKALREVVAPAVDPAQKLAVEQLGLSIATLTMVMDRIPYSRKLVRKELAITIDMAEAIKTLTPTAELATAIETARIILQDVDAENSDIKTAKVILMGLISGLVDDVEDIELRIEISRIIVRESKAQADLYRRWCSASGFDQDMSRLPTFEETLGV